jgi:UDP-N-acetylglucosamine 4,6-dehydratase
MEDIFKGKTVLVTGGTGSFGQKFAEIVLKNYDIRRLRIFSRDEMKQFEMRHRFNDKRLRFFIGDVRDPDRLHRAFNDVDIVVHAAALKIVPTAEYNPFETVKTNILGAENVINVAIDNGVKKVIAISTDKAANPINLYGATKLCAEKIFLAANNYSPKDTKFSVVRYGNVFNSRGSVVPFFRMKSKEENTIPITDARMTRFWITLEEGVNFVIRSIRDMQGGEIFIPKSPSIRIIDLAKAIAPHCKTKIIGIRPGEKLHETLVPSDDARFTFEEKDRFITCPEVVFHNIKRREGKALPLDFPGYRSDNNREWLGVNELKKMLAQGE